MIWIKQNIGSIGLWLVTISFAVYYFFARYYQVLNVERPLFVNNIEFYGSLIGMLLISLDYAVKCQSRIERVIIAWGLVSFWGMLSLVYFLDEFLDSIIFTHKIITVIILCIALCPLLYLYFRKRL